MLYCEFCIYTHPVNFKFTVWQFVIFAPNKLIQNSQKTKFTYNHAISWYKSYQFKSKSSRLRIIIIGCSPLEQRCLDLLFVLLAHINTLTHAATIKQLVQMYKSITAYKGKWIEGWNLLCHLWKVKKLNNVWLSIWNPFHNEWGFLIIS